MASYTLSTYQPGPSRRPFRRFPTVARAAPAGLPWATGLRTLTSATNPGEQTRTARFAGLVGAGLLASRILGLVRDVLLAFFLGTGHVAEAWMVAFRIPNVLRMFLTEGSMNSAFVPVLNEYLESRPGEVRRLVSAATSALAGLLLVITASGALLAPYFVPLVAPGFIDVPGKVELTSHLMSWVFLYLFFAGVAALFMAVLQSKGSFLTSAIAPGLFNVVLIAALFLICPLFGSEHEAWVNGLVVGALVAGLVQVLIQLPPLRRAGLLPRPTFRVRHPGVIRIGRLMLPTFVGVGVAELAIIANTFLASLLEAGAVAAIEYATRIVQVPYMVCAGALSTAMLPLLSRQSARGEHTALLRTLSSTLRAVAFLMVPLSLLTVLMARPVVELLLERGAFAAESTAQTTLALRYFAPLLVGGSLLRLVTAAFFSIQDTRTPVRVATVSLVFNVLLGLALMGPLGVGGLSFAIALTPCLGGGILLVVLARRLGGFPVTGWYRTLAITGLGSLGLVIVVSLVEAAIGSWAMTLPDVTSDVIRLGVPTVAGLGFYVLVARVGRSTELSFVLGLLRRRRS